jgi:Tfp pilus assembly protein FimT
MLILGLLVVATSLAAPAMSKFVRGRALDSEARRLAALMHAGQSRAVSEGAPMVLWVDEKQGTYGLQAETTGQNGDAKAENLTVDATLQIAVVNAGMTPVTFQNLPAIRFLMDGTVDENSPQDADLDGQRRGYALAGVGQNTARVMKFATPKNKRSAGGAAPPCQAFTLAEVMAALLFLAIVIPVAIEAMHVASLAGEVGARRARRRAWPTGF